MSPRRRRAEFRRRRWRAIRQLYEQAYLKAWHDSDSDRGPYGDGTYW